MRDLGYFFTLIRELIRDLAHSFVIFWNLRVWLDVAACEEWEI